jgi:steroid 5-alpha reductase family enzyme
MAEQDTYNSHLGNLGLSEERREKARAAMKAYDLKHSTGSEVDRYGSHFKWERPDRTVDTSWSSPGAVGSPGPPGAAGLASKAEQEALNSRFAYPRYRSLDTTTIGILKSTILPSFGLQSGLSILAYGASSMTNRVDGKDWAWPAGQVIQAWWSAVGARVACDKVDVSTAYSALDYPHKLVLWGVTLWGGRLFYRVVSRSIARGHDDERYEKVKEEPDFWGKSLFTIFLPEAVFQTLISLPFTLPFRETQQSFTSYPVPAFAELATGLGIFSFCAGFALEVLADVQLAEHSETSKDLDKTGVWSIVRHPK